MFWFLTVNYKIGCHRKGCEFVLAWVPISCISPLGWMLGTDMRPLVEKNKEKNIIMKNETLIFHLVLWQESPFGKAKRTLAKQVAPRPLPRRPAKRTPSFERSSPDRSRPRASRWFFPPQFEVCRRQMIKSGAFTGVGHVFEFCPLINYMLTTWGSGSRLGYTQVIITYFSKKNIGIYKWTLVCHYMIFVKPHCKCTQTCFTPGVGKETWDWPTSTLRNITFLALWANDFWKCIQ